MKFLPDKKQWTLLVQKAREEIRKGRLEKVVLGRCAIHQFSSPPDPFALTSSLPPLGAMRFCFVREGKAFLGATPELLFSRKQRRLHLVAMAGTRPRGATPDADHILEQELLASPKDLHEWSFIPRHFCEVLTPLCTSPPRFSKPTVYKTPNVQHLYGTATATLLSPITDAQLLETLHPTPALCGTPRDAALTFIHAHEPFDRGPFGAPIGWSTPDAAEYHIAIRCCTLENREMRIYTAAGIVADSDPDAEWEELNSKMNLFQEIFQ